MNWVQAQYPNASQYGWLADDTFPRTRGWDEKLEEAAGHGYLAYANDLWLSRDPGARDALERGADLSSGLCWGGDLVRAVGWWALPGTRQAGIDTAWTAIVGKLRRHRYLDDVVVEHHNWRTGKRKRDRSDSWVRRGQNYVQEDIDLRNAWFASRDYLDTLDRVSQLCPLETGEQREVAREVGEIRIARRRQTQPRPQVGPPLARLLKGL